MHKLTFVAATIALGALLVPAQAEMIAGAPNRNGDKCFKLSPSQTVKDNRFGVWGACPQTASTTVAPAAQRRTTRRPSSR
jgi:hypothetical protein